MKPASSKDTFLLNGRCLLPDGSISERSLLLAGGKILRIQEKPEPRADLAVEGTIVPGFIDLQINGGYGFDFTQEAGSVPQVARRLPETGTTAFLPTVITSNFGAYPKKLSLIQEAIADTKATGARPLGMHLEGPYLNPIRHAAHPKELIRPIDLDEFKQWAGSERVKLVTLAAELENGLQAVRWLKMMGKIISIGHTDATYAQATQALEAGIGWATHLFNAMRPLHHREPGVIGAILEASIPCGIIADGIHVHPSLVKLAYRLKGPMGLVLVTDAMAALGMAPGDYQLSEHRVIVSEKDARLADGTLAGSLLRMDQAVRNAMAFCGCSLFDAVRMASLAPARLLGLDGTYGQIEPGYSADLVVLDEKLVPSHTFVGGRLVFERA
jgi:N-acetylglucosamine-6-phosphate deacetylase